MIKGIKINLFKNSGVPLSIKLIVVFFILICQSSVFSQYPELNLRYFSKSDGLASTNIYSVVQDSTGYIWIGTNNGLDRFDGYGFTHYSAITKDTTSLTSNKIQKLFIDSKGKLWIGTNMGLCTYNEEKDYFNHILADYSNENIVEDFNIKDIIEDHKGNIVILTSIEVFKYNIANKNFTLIKKIDKGVGNKIMAYHNNIWIGTNEDGFIKFNTIDSTFTYYRYSKNENSVNCNSIFDFDIWKNQLWIATMGGGINVLDLETGIFKVVPYASPDEIYSFEIYVDNNNNLWSIDYTGLKYYDENQGGLIGYYPDEKDPYSIRSAVHGIMQDKNDNYWLYHEPGGIAISTIPPGFRHYSSNSRAIWHLSDSKILAIQEDRDGNLWMGNASNGIDIFNWQRNEIIKYRYNPDAPYGLGKGATQCIIRDSKNVMWISNYHTGLQYFDKESGRFISFGHDPNDSTSLACNDIRDIFESSDGYLYLAVHGKGIDKFDRKTGKFYHYNNAQNNLSNDWTYDITEDKDGNIWVASAWGLSVLPKGKDKFNFYYSTQEDSTSLSESNVQCLLCDSYGNIWAGTINGLNKFNKKTNNFTRYTNFESNFICSILEDNKNNIWVSTQEGLSRLNLKKNRIENFDANEGVRAGEFYATSCYSNNANTLYFGGTKGVDYINTDQLVINNSLPKIIINQLKLFNETVTNKSNPELLNNQISATKSITLNYQQKVINIGYVALNYANTSKNIYKYKLEGFDKVWNYVGSKREAVYTNLDPGEYNFKVVASNNDNIWNDNFASLKIKILPAWYQTFVFRILVLLLIAGIITLVILLRTKALRRQQTLLKQKVIEKTEELVEKNKLLEEKSSNLKEANSLLIERQYILEEQSAEIKKQSKELESANKELETLNQTKDKLFSIIAHDLTSPFNTILGFSDLLVQTFNDMSDKEKLRLATIINTSSVKVFSLLQNLLLWTRSQTNRINYYPENINLLYVINDTLELQKAVFTQKNINIQVNCNKELELNADLEMLKTIIRNLINNAIKFTRQYGKISISAAQNTENNNVEICISDSGIGISQDIIDKILNSKPITSSDGTEGEKGTGLGLSICKEFIHINKGELEITSETGKGSKFIFTIPSAKVDIEEKAKET